MVLIVHLGGRDLPFVVDTGAPTNILSTAFAWYLDLPVESTELTLDAGLARVPLVRLVGGLSLPPFGRSELFSAYLPRLDDVGYAGVISPQALVSEGEAVMIDLAKGTLVLTNANVVASSRFELKGEACNGQLGLHYLVDAMVSGHRARLTIDTGAPQTWLDANSVAGRALLNDAKNALVQSELDGLLGSESSVARAHSEVAGGPVATERVAIVPHQRITGGGTTLTLDVQISKNPGICHSDGSLGLDFLAGWTLILTPKGLVGQRNGGTHPEPMVVTPALPAIVYGGIDVVGSCPGGTDSRTITSEPRRYDDPLEAWVSASDQLHRVGEAYAGACARDGYLRADVTTALPIAGDRRTMRGVVTITPGRRYRNGRITLHSIAGSPPEIQLERLVENDWYDISRVRAQSLEIDRRLGPTGLHVVRETTQVDDGAGRVDVDFLVGR